MFISTDRAKRGQMLQVCVTVGRQKILHNRMVIQLPCLFELGSNIKVSCIRCRAPGLVD